MKIGLCYVLVLLPTTLFLVWWKASMFAYDYFGCQGSKGLPLPCMWNGIDVQGWFFGTLFGYILFWLSLPFAAYFCLEIWLRAYKAKRVIGSR